MQVIIDKYLGRIRSRIPDFYKEGKFNKRSFQSYSRREKLSIAAELKDYVIISLEVMTDRSALIEISKSILSGFSRFANAIESNIIYDIQSGIRKGITTYDIEKRVSARLDTAQKVHSRTLVQTSLSGINEAKRIEYSVKHGVKKFKLVGPPAERDWCKDHLGKSYTIEEIKEMDNGQKLPVLYFKGGYRCVHTWVDDE